MLPVIHEETTLGILQYWTNYADHAELPVSRRNGWEITRSSEDELHCAHPRLGFELLFRITPLPGGFEISLPKAGLKETHNRFHSLLLLPGLCRKREGDAGYFLLPQQSGVVSRFSNKHDACYEIGVYGSGFSECNMPVFGMADADSILTAVIASGHCDAALQLETARGDEKIYSLAPRFFFRHEFHVRRQSAPMVNDDIRVRYRALPLAGRSGAAVLAEEYRGFRLAAGEIAPLAERAAGNPHLAQAMKSPEIRIRMGVKWPFPMTVAEQTPENEPEVHVFCTFDQAAEIAAACKRQGVRNANFCLVGWAAKGHDGRYPQILPVEEAFGGEAALRALIPKVRELGYTISAHDNHYDAYSASRDPFDDLLIRTIEGFPMKDGVWGGGQAYLLCPEAMLKGYTMRNLAAIRELGFEGIHFTDCLSTTGLKVCHDPRHPNTKTRMAHWRREILRRIRETFGGAQCEGPFDFAAGVLDRILYIESGDKGDGLSAREYVDEIVPLYQLVYHGILLYNLTGESINAVPGSQLYLRNLAFGGMPYFYFYRHFATKNYLPGTNTPVAGRFETSDFTLDDLDEEAAAIKRAACDFIETLGDLQGVFMMDFTRLSETVTRTDYASGDSVYVNFGDAPAEAEGVKLEAHSFTRRKRV